MKDSSGDKRKIYLDILRIIAIFLVIFNHTGTQGFFVFGNPGHRGILGLLIHVYIL